MLNALASADAFLRTLAEIRALPETLHCLICGHCDGRTQGGAVRCHDCYYGAVVRQEA